jgi:hypothetical protein
MLPISFARLEFKEDNLFLNWLYNILNTMKSEWGFKAPDRGQPSNLCDGGEKETKCITGEKEISSGALGRMY